MPKRRANGEGNIRKRKDGRWEGRYTAGYDPESGKRIIKNVLGKTQAEVKEKLKTAISESQKLDVSKAGTYTVSSWMKTWYEVYAEPRIRPNTKAYYTNYIENHIIPGIGSVPLNKLTTIQIQRFYNNLQKSGRVQRKNFPILIFFNCAIHHMYRSIGDFGQSFIMGNDDESLSQPVPQVEEQLV